MYEYFKSQTSSFRATLKKCFVYINKTHFIFTRMHFDEIKQSAYGYRDKTRYFLTRTFGTLNYKDLISIFQLNL